MLIDCQLKNNKFLLILPDIGEIQDLKNLLTPQKWAAFLTDRWEIEEISTDN